MSDERHRVHAHRQTLEGLPDADPHTLTLSEEPRGGEKVTSGLQGTSIGALGLTCVAR